MSYVYKVVSLETFLEQKKDLKIFTTDFSEMGNGVAYALEVLINYYAEDGWEYVISENIDAAYFKTTGAAVFEGLFKSASVNGPRPVYIFRKELTFEEKVKIKEKSEIKIKELQSDAKSKGLVNADLVGTADSKCPSCSALIRSVDTECWKCKADFGPHSSWRPERL
jgi:hypothetical protein